MSERSSHSSQHREDPTSRFGNSLPAVSPATSTHSLQQNLDYQHQYQQRQGDYPASVHSQVYSLDNVSAVDQQGYYEHTQEEGEGEQDMHQQDSTREEIRSPSVVFTDLPEPPHRPPTRGELFRMRVLGVTTVPRLQVLWGLLALFGTMAWLAIMPAYAFRNKNEQTGFFNSAYTFFLVATVGTSVAALWQSLCPFLIRHGQRSLWPRIINHSATQTTTIVISVILTILNFFSWIILASNKDGAKTSCQEGPLSDRSGYVAQCRGVNVALVLDAIVFLLWTPIALIIVCGMIDKGFWWSKHDRWAQGKDPSMMARDEYDLKRASRDLRFNASMDNISQLQYDEIQTPKLAFVTPIASHFKSSTELNRDSENEEGHDNTTVSVPQQLYQHHQQQHNDQRVQQLRQQDPRRLHRNGSNSSLSPSFGGRLSGIFGAGWGNGPMPPPSVPEPAAPSGSTKHRAGLSRFKDESLKPSSDVLQVPEPDKASLNGDAYMTQWHSRRHDDWS
ncbi:hypothetical protein EDD21DRAFT_371395 [Dissophora ornata]|nr:hypothetical protein EDD21DRAFT_371395 [Dissophora ornata]